jgi:membrane-associated protease RseP (regulator of RpoE activity)
LTWINAGRPHSTKTENRSNRQRMEIAMRANIGMVDRTARVIIGLILIAYAIPVGFATTGWNWVGWIGVVPILTALLGVCPAYSLFGITTCAAKSAQP